MMDYRNKINLVLYVLCSLTLVHCGRFLDTKIESDSSVALSLGQECRPLQDIENYPYVSLNVKNARDLDKLYDKELYQNMNNTLDDFLTRHCRFNDVDNVLGTQDSFQLKNQVETINRIEVRFEALQPFCLISQSGDTKTESSPLFGFSFGGNAGLRRIGMYGEDSFLTAESEMGAMGFLIDSSKPYSVCLESDFKKYIWLRKKDTSRRFSGDGPSFIYTYLPEDYPVEVSHNRSFLQRNLSNILYEDIPLKYYLDTSIYSISEFSQEDENWLKEKGYTRVDDDSLGDSNTFSLSDKTHFGYGYYFECKNHRKVCVKYNTNDSKFYATKRFSFEDFKSLSDEEIDKFKGVYLSFTNLKDWKVEELTPYQFGIMMRYTPQNMRNNKLEDSEAYLKVSDISIDSIRNLTEEHIESAHHQISNKFSPEQLQAVLPEGMKYIYIKSFTPDIIRLLNRKQLNNVVKNIDKPSQGYLEDVTRKQVQSIDPDMIKELSFFPDESARYLTKAQIEMITPEQIQTTILNRTSIYIDYFPNLLTPEQVSWLSPFQMEAFVEACEKRRENFGYCPHFDEEQIGALSFDSFKVLYPNPKEKAPSNTYYTYSKEKILYLRENKSFSEIANFVENNEDFFKKPESYINSFVNSHLFRRLYHLEPKEFRNITLDQMNSFPDFFVMDIPLHKLMEIPVFGQWLPSVYIGEVQYFNPFLGRGESKPPVTKEYIQSIPVSQIPDMDPQVFLNLDFEKYQFLSSDQLLAMTSEQLARVTDYRDISTLYIMERDGVDEETKNNFLRLMISSNDRFNTSEARIEEEMEKTKMYLDRRKKIRIEECENKSKRSSYWKETIFNECMSEWRLTQN